MTWKHFFTSSIGKKLVMGFTGLFLISFLVVHVTINSMIFLNDGGAEFNAVAHFMSHNIIIRLLEVGLFAGLILHIVQGLMLASQNNSKGVLDTPCPLPTPTVPGTAVLWASWDR